VSFLAPWLAPWTWRPADPARLWTAALAGDVRELRRCWSAELTLACDRALRSPAFLDVARFTLAALSRPPHWFRPLPRR